MKTYTLIRWVVFGKGDASDAEEFEIEVTDEQYALLKRCEEDEVDFYDIPDEELISKICTLAEEESKEELDPDDEDGAEFYDYMVGFCNSICP